MFDPHIILRNTSRLAAVGMAGVCAVSWAGGNGAPMGFLLAALLILVDIAVLIVTVEKMNQVLAAGGNGGLALVVLQGRFLITLFAIVAIGSATSMESVLAGVVLAFVAFTLAAIHTAFQMMAAPLETM